MRLIGGSASRGPLADVVEDPRGECRPAGLMAGAQAAPGVAVEVLVEEHQVAPVLVLGEAAVVAVACPPAGGVTLEEPRQAPSQLLRYRVEIHHAPRAGRTFHLQRLAVEMMVF